MSVLSKIAGKTKYVMSIFLILLVLLDRWQHLGLTEDDWARIFQFAALALGADAVEGIASNWKRQPPPATPPGSPPGG